MECRSASFMTADCFRANELAQAYVSTLLLRGLLQDMVTFPAHPL